MKTKTKSRPDRSTASDPGVKGTASGRSGFRAQTILVPIDFSEPSRNALRYAFSLAQQHGGRLILFYALEPVATPDFAYHPLMMEPAEATATAEQQVRKISSAEGIDEASIAEVVVRQGVAHVQITEAARSLKADLIVISTHGHTGLKHVLLGSTAERVVRHASCPVLVVRAHA